MVRFKAELIKPLCFSLKQWQRVNRLTAEKKLVAVEDVETAVDPSPGSLYVGYPPGLCSHIGMKALL